MTLPIAPCRAGIIGTGRIASLLERDPLRSKPHTHAGWYAAEPRTALVAGCDIDPERLVAFGEQWNVPGAHRYANYSEMLARERLDIVSVCAYAGDRLAMCRAAAEAGVRGLWIEKAIASSVNEGLELQRVLDAAGVAAVVDHPRRAEARYRAVEAWLRDETFGRLESVHVLFSGHVIHTGTHAWDLLLAWCGPWARVDAMLDSIDPGGPTGGDGREDDPARAALEAAMAEGAVPDRGGRARITFANGVEAFVSGGAKRYFVFQIDLIFANGRVRIGNDVWEVLSPAPSPRYTGYRELAPLPSEATVVPTNVHSSLLASLIDAMDTGIPPAQSVASANAALALGIAIMQAGLSGTRVTPDTLDATLRVASV